MRIFAMTSGKPEKMASPMRKCPMFNSTICGRAAIVLALSTSIACAQQSPIEQALIAKLNLETSAGLQCSAALITLGPVDANSTV